MVVWHGLYLAAFLVAYGLGFRALGLTADSPAGLVFYVALPVAVFLSLTASRRAGKQTFWSGLARGAIVVAIGSIAYGAYVYVYNSFVDDSLIEWVRARALADIDAADPDASAKVQRVRFLTMPHTFAATITLQLLVAGVASALAIAPFRRAPDRAANS